MFCRERNLPHPGFIILDTPLLTCRDPLKNKKAVVLSPDEQALQNTSLKDFFFEHLAEVAKLGQIIVVENVDPPSDLSSVAHIEPFTGDPSNGRFGLFPIRASWTGMAEDSKGLHVRGKLALGNSRANDAFGS